MVSIKLNVISDSQDKFFNKGILKEVLRKVDLECQAMKIIFVCNR